MIKRGIDICLSILALCILFPFIFFFIVVSMIDTQSNGLFFQSRIGQFGKTFIIYKIRTFHLKKHTISKFGKWLRKTKLDETPQFFNVLFGTMSIVGPRPDIAGYYDNLDGEEKNIIKLKPGLTSLATIKYIDEEKILNEIENKEIYMREVLFRDKVKMNLAYYNNQSLILDLKIMIKTLWVIISK